MSYVFIKLNILCQLVHIAVNAHADISAFFRIGQHLFVHTLLRADDRSEHHKALPLAE